MTWAKKRRYDRHGSWRSCKNYAIKCGYSNTLSEQKWIGSYRQQGDPFLRMISKIYTTLVPLAARAPCYNEDYSAKVAACTLVWETRVPTRYLSGCELEKVARQR
jgi:hypothetical protein